MANQGHSRSSTSEYLGVYEEPVTGYIVQHNNCGLKCEGSGEIASERSENRRFRGPAPLSFELTRPDALHGGSAI